MSHRARRFGIRLNPGFAMAILLLVAMGPRLTAADISRSSRTAEDPALAQFHKMVEPILREHCYDCHGDGSSRAGLAFDDLVTEGKVLHNPEVWLKVLRNTRSHLMPPADHAPPTAAEQLVLEQWITTAGFGLNPARPDPGRVTVRRLNRTEYRNTIRDLLGVDFDAEAALPPDDIGYGFDNIGDVLSISPMRMEKFIEAAMAAVEKGVPKDTVVIPAQLTLPTDFHTADGAQTAEHLSFYQVRTVTHRYQAKATGDYRVIISSKVDGEANPDPQQVRITGLSDGKEFFRAEYHWSDAEYYNDERIVHWEQGEHEIGLATQPLLDLQPLKTKMEYKILYVRLEGPLDRKDWEQAPGYRRFYSRDVPPEKPAARRTYARETLTRFVTKAYRRPVDRATVEQLVDLAEKTYSTPGNAFEKGIAQAMVAALASPRFLFHFENAEPAARGQQSAQVDEYTLAERLSYCLWSSMPDEELTGLAARGELRKNFRAQVQRMLADPKAQALAENFSGQWLQSRGVLDTPINSAEVMARETPRSPPVAVVVDAPVPDAVVAVLPAVSPAPAAAPVAVGNARAGAAPGRAGAPAPNAAPGRGRGRGPAVLSGTALTPEIRAAMKRETEAYFSHIIHDDCSVLELLDSDYTFVNDQLAAVYGIPNISGPEMRRVTLPPGDLRGGVLTMGSVLTVTSNPTRTSPVKRGKWILENILGSPPPPPPPNIPALEEAQAKLADRPVTQRELLALHRADPKCASCHARMDPLGLALENFNAFGRARTQENGVPIEPAGELATGEKFNGVREVKRALVEGHRIEFYRTLTEKLFTYALGRGMEYYDVPAVDRIVGQLEKDNGRFSTLLLGVLESVPFQQRRLNSNAVTPDAKPALLTSQTGPSR